MKVIKLNAIASTNSYLKELNSETEVADGTLVWAETQTKGRGQRANHWHSKAGESLTFSMLKRFEALQPHRQFYISMAVSIAVAKTLKELLVPDVKIKWPNDILSDNNKLCGILIESQLRAGMVQAAVIGIGLNVNEEGFEGLPRAGSIYQVTGVKFDLEEILRAVALQIEQQLQGLHPEALPQLVEEYEALLFRKDEISVFEDPNGLRFNGIIRGVLASGRLRLETEAHGVKEYDKKELTMLY